MTNKQKRVVRDADIDAEMDRGDRLLTKLLQRVGDTKKADSGFIRTNEHMKRTKTMIQALVDEDLDEETLLKINGSNGVITK